MNYACTKAANMQACDPRGRIVSLSAVTEALDSYVSVSGSTSSPTPSPDQAPSAHPHPGPNSNSKAQDPTPTPTASAEDYSRGVLIQCRHRMDVACHDQYGSNSAAGLDTSVQPLSYRIHCYSNGADLGGLDLDLFCGDGWHSANPQRFSTDVAAKPWKPGTASLTRYCWLSASAEWRLVANGSNRTVEQEGDYVYTNH